MCYNFFYHFSTYIFDGKVMLALSFILIVDFLAGSKQIKSLFVIRVLYVFVSFSLRSLTRWSLDWQPWNRKFYIKNKLAHVKAPSMSQFFKFLKQTNKQWFYNPFRLKLLIRLSWIITIYLEMNKKIIGVLHSYGIQKFLSLYLYYAFLLW